MKVQINGSEVTLNIDGEKLLVSMDGYDTLNSTGAIQKLKKYNGSWTTKGRNTKRMSLQRFILTDGGKIELGKDIRAIRVNDNTNDHTTKNLKAVNHEEYTQVKLLPGKENSTGTGIKYVKWNESEQQFEARVQLCDGIFKTERFKDIKDANSVVRGLQEYALHHAEQKGDTKYLHNRKRKWNF